MDIIDDKEFQDSLYNDVLKQIQEGADLTKPIKVATAPDLARAHYIEDALLSVFEDIDVTIEKESFGKYNISIQSSK